MTREFSRNIKSKGIIISETTSWGWHGIKQPSGKHNTINILLTRGARVLGEYSVEVAVQTVNLLLSASMVRIHLLPPNLSCIFMQDIFYAVKKTLIKQNVLNMLIILGQ